jgi:hypothetical protein
MTVFIVKMNDFVIVCVKLKDLDPLNPIFSQSLSTLDLIRLINLRVERSDSTYWKKYTVTKLCDKKTQNHYAKYCVASSTTHHRHRFICTSDCVYLPPHPLCFTSISILLIYKAYIRVKWQKIWSILRWYFC